MAQDKSLSAELSHLPRADGSATFSHGGFTVVASANGPLEAGRRDEDPFEAVVDVTVRPAAGIGGTRERHLEDILQRVLRQLILVKNFPRSLVQVTLQITETPANDYANTKLVQAQLNLPVIPALLHAATLALISGSIPLRGFATAGLFAILAADDAKTKKVIPSPSTREISSATSLHVMGFTSHDELVLVESEGRFSPGDWDEVARAARRACCTAGDGAVALGDAMDEGGGGGDDVRRFVREVVKRRVGDELAWVN